MNILITGSNGFIGKSFARYLKNHTNHNIYEFNKNDHLINIEKIISIIDIVFHFAGINRSEEKTDFKKVNIDLTRKICMIISRNPNITLFYASSIQIHLNNHYGNSKREAEKICLELQNKFKNRIQILRLPGVFGNGCKPNYNSVVATFCHNVANNIELNIIEPNKEIELLFVEDLCKQLTNLIDRKSTNMYVKLQNINKISIKKLANTIKNFNNEFKNIDFLKSKNLLERNLYKTFISYKS